ncbi:uncharacterized protein zgc:66455 [Takifugu flavidus]|uniref:uncharacterized protein zgc:66455 n=1 Tax=Takifugu flavidus TaxID=433684 RepID=UPI0025440523|nr:uncharacterized protein zgc:66455 [Takifugu flavidus]
MVFSCSNWERKQQLNSGCPESSLLCSEMMQSRRMLLYVFAGLWMLCDSKVSSSPGDDGAFFALRSCHQQLGGDSGEFFSPDYLCSNPPLWCNWTIRVDPTKRVHLDLEDLTPADACHVKQDQLHVEDPAGGHKLLLKCWRETKFTSSTNMLEVVLLIGGWPSVPYRGFYGRYQAFGPPVVYDPEEILTGETSDPGLVESDLPADSGHLFDLMAEEPEDNEKMDVFHHPVTTELVFPPTLSVSTSGTAQAQGGQVTSSDRPPIQSLSLAPHKLRPPNHTSPGTPGEVLEGSSPQDEGEGEEESANGHNHSPSPVPLPREESETDQSDSEPNVMEPQSDRRGNFNTRNLSESPHLPGDHLFEVAVEVTFSQDLDESWDHVARSLLLSVKALISDQLKALQTPLSMSSKRIKRLNAGALFILWVQLSQEPGDLKVHGVIHATLQGLIATDVIESRSGAVIVSVSTADVNECGTQLVLCDVNADCVNWFGSYSCRCRPGFRDVSRLGSGGTVCIDMTSTGFGSGLAAETKGVYVLFFLLSSLVLMLLAAAGLLYHRHRRGAFQVHCQSTGNVSDPNNNRHRDNCGPAELPPLPPPPPARGLRESWPRVKECCPAVELPLLRFSPLMMEGYKEPQERGKI